MNRSPCRICGAWRVQGYHFVPVDIGGPTTNIPNPYVRKEECVPSDNLEYLEQQYEKRNVQK